MCSVEELIYNDQIVFQLHRSKQSSPGITQQWHTAVLMWPSYFIYQHKYQQTYQIMGCFLIRVNCQTAELRNAWGTVRLRKTPGGRVWHASCMRWNAVHLTTCQGWRAACWSHRPSSKGSKKSARTAFSVAQDVERSLGSPRMLHGHLHQLHASFISCMMNRRVFHKILPHWQRKFTTVQVDIEQPYVQLYIVLKKKDPSTGIPCIFEKFKNRPDFALLIRAD